MIVWYGLGRWGEVAGCRSVLEAALIVSAIVRDWKGWNWDARHVQRWVDAVVEGSIKEERKRKELVEPDVEKMENGKGEKAGLEERSDERRCRHVS